MLYTLLAFVITVLVIVAIHEYGHFLSMRLFGVRVLTFSIGFGPRLWSYTARSGTEFAISAIPLGGYVRPLDRRESKEIPPEQAHEEFSGKPVWQRIITYIAGPAANFVLALVIYWVVLMGGQTMLAPVMGAVPADSAAAHAGFHQGDELLSVGGYKVRGWHQVTDALLHYAGDAGEVPVQVRQANGNEATRQLSLAPWAADLEKQSPFDALGLVPRTPRAVAGRLIEGGAAAAAGLKPGDRILAVNGKSMKDWTDWVKVVRDNPGQPLKVQIRRDGQAMEVTVTPKQIQVDGKTIGRVGMMAADIREVKYGPLAAVPQAFARLDDQVSMIMGAIRRMLTGQLSVKTLGGPITIAQAAGETASVGVSSFLMFLAFFSVSLGIINLLPIPMLDGGWVLFGLIEWVRGRELPERFLMVAQSIGMTMVFALLLVALYNDLMRQF